MRAVLNCPRACGFEGPLRPAKGIRDFYRAVGDFSIWNAFRNCSLISELPPQLVPIVAAVGGLCSGLFGVGGATFTYPNIYPLFGFSQAEAQGMALACGSSPSDFSEHHGIHPCWVCRLASRPSVGFGAALYGWLRRRISAQTSGTRAKDWTFLGPIRWCFGSLDG